MRIPKSGYFISIAILAAYVSPRLLDAQAQDVRADFDRANSLRTRIAGKVYGVADSPTWIDNSRLWFRKSVQGGSEFVLVDAATGSMRPAFDHAQVAARLSSIAGTSYTAATLPFESFTFSDEKVV